ncbi:MAG: hypothetical protein PHX72_00405 [Candidatus Shapirobacteria bacterium]|nr:hypothetical protein [Candidatus Shapirobacteria bacterium]
MMKENGTLITLFVLVFLILGIFWWLNRQGEDLTPTLLTTTSSTPAVETDETAIKNDLLKNYNQSQDKMEFNLLEVVNNYARGLVSFSEDSRVWLWLAYREQESEQWRILHDGQGLVGCQVLEQADFPSSLAAECWDQERNQLVTR